VQTALWPQGDVRDPLGVWGARDPVTGDASGGGIKSIFFVGALRKAAYLYTCIHLNYAMLTGTPVTTFVKGRLLSNWPDIDPTAGVQAYGSLLVADTEESSGFTAPVQGIRARDDLLGHNGHLVLLFDPRSQGSDTMDIVEMETSTNVDLATYSFEAYGYFWDRSVLQAPGGPRHPGSGSR